MNKPKINFCCRIKIRFCNILSIFTAKTLFSLKRRILFAVVASVVVVATALFVASVVVVATALFVASVVASVVATAVVFASVVDFNAVVVATAVVVASVVDSNAIFGV